MSFDQDLIIMPGDALVMLEAEFSIYIVWPRPYPHGSWRLSNDRSPAIYRDCLTKTDSVRMGANTHTFSSSKTEVSTDSHRNSIIVTTFPHIFLLVKCWIYYYKHVRVNKLWKRQMLSSDAAVNYNLQIRGNFVLNHMGITTYNTLWVFVYLQQYVYPHL